MRTLILAGLFTLAFAGVSFAQSAPPCGPYDTVRDALANRFGEYRIGSGVTPQGYRIEMFASKDGASWTMIAVRGDGMGCYVMEGVSWEIDASPFPLESRSDTNPSLP